MELTPERQPIINITGETIALGPVRRDLLPLYLKWINDFEVTRTTVGFRPMTQEGEEAWYEGVSRSQRDVMFTVYERATMRPIGNAELAEIDHFHRRADFHIAIGEKECWGKGYGSEATARVLDYGFTALGLHNIALSVWSYNERAIRAYQKAGFREFGRRREAVRLGGRAFDIVYMDCLATAFESPVLWKVVEAPRPSDRG